jgi:transposase InsO family protein
MDADLVIPVDPVRSGDHHIIHPLPTATEIDKPTFVQAVQRFRGRIIVRITFTPDRPDRFRFLQSLRVADRRIYTVGAFRQACQRLGACHSMGRPGSALDNAVIESWHSTLEFELRSVEHFTTPGARAVHVPRSRFAPVKTTDDLLVVRSDAYELTSDRRMRPSFDGLGPVVTLDKDFYKMLPDFEQRFPAGAPSLRRCRRFEVEGDVTFRAGVMAAGDVRVTGPRHVPDGEVLGR